MKIDPEVSARLTGSLRTLPRQAWSHLLAGILIAVPLIVTVWVLSLGYSFISKISEPIWTTLGVNNVPLLNFVTTIILLVAVGAMAAHVMGRKIIDHTESVLLRLPLIAPLYGAVKQVLDSVRLMSSGAQAKRVVYLEYPSEGSLLLGFVTGQYFEPNLQRQYTLVFLPMAPNPLAGFVVAVPEERIITCSLTFEEATKLIVSGGLVVPPRVASVEPPTIP